MEGIFNLIKHYYAERGFRIPTTEQAVMWAQTEIGEVCELLLARIGGWKRNNPDSHPKFSKELLAEELGDVIMMLLVAGIAEGVDPLHALRMKMRRKLEELET